MAPGKVVLSVVPDIIVTNPENDGTVYPRSGQMPANTCAPGCTCGRHGGKTFVSAQATRDAYYAENRERIIARTTQYNKRPERVTPRRESGRKGSAKYREKNRAAINAKARAAYNPAVDSQRSRKWKFGLSPEETLRLFTGQRGRCYMGGEPLNLDAPRGYFVDHARWCCPGSKSCGRCVRGLTCNNCNVGAGHFSDDPARLRHAADAIEAADSSIVARRSTGPVQAELPIDIKRAARRREAS
jgi:hypothetical protein